MLEVVVFGEILHVLVELILWFDLQTLLHTLLLSEGWVCLRYSCLRYSCLRYSCLRYSCLRYSCLLIGIDECWLGRRKYESGQLNNSFVYPKDVCSP